MFAVRSLTGAEGWPTVKVERLTLMYGPAARCKRFSAMVEYCCSAKDCPRETESDSPAILQKREQPWKASIVGPYSPLASRRLRLCLTPALPRSSLPGALQK